MLKTLDILIGATTVLVLFSMAVTVITQAFTSFFNKRGKYLLVGLANLLQHIGIDTRPKAEAIAKALLLHPMVTPVAGKLGTVVGREEFTTLLLDLAGGQGAGTFDNAARSTLQDVLKKNGVTDPDQTLNDIRKMALMLQTSHPDLPTHIRSEMAIVRECATDYVAKVNAWFDQTIDRVSQAFSKHAQRVTVVAAFLIAIGSQLDIIAVVDRLSIDDQFRTAVVGQAAPKIVQDIAPGNSPTVSQADTKLYYNLLDGAGLITLPTDNQWVEKIKDPRKYPGIILAALLISLGAPFWYNILKDLLGLRSSLAQADDAQRAIRQAPRPVSNSPSLAAPIVIDESLQGEQGDLAAVG
jgi:hypothetical protein